MRTPYGEQMDEQMERYVIRRLSSRLKSHMDIQNMQSTRKGKVRRLLILIFLAALLTFVMVLSQVL